MTIPYDDFKRRFKLLASKRQDLVVNTLSNIFTMRLIGNKTHGDLAEIGIAEFINQFMYDFKSIHVGKDLFRAKKHEEDIVIINELSQAEFPVSLKAYSNGPLQLSTDRESKMFPFLEAQGKTIVGQKEISRIFAAEAFANFSNINVMPLIYDEKSKRCNILVFDHDKAKRETAKILCVGRGESITGKSKGRKHPIYTFLDAHDHYICEVRYGDAAANALQRGLWTHTQHAAPFFDSLTDGWIDYTPHLALVKLFSLALNATEQGHTAANVILQQDLDQLKSAK
ncbi:hypothetical protein AGMMS49959_08000 [Planctomycetales bacterium]|nr:hypothetical protein AGMMS49959_08000 [Planctomycetales bacterium]